MWTQNVNPTITTDNKQGAKLATIEDGIIMLQINNNTNVNIYLTLKLNDNTDFKFNGITVPPNTLWPTNGPTLWRGNLYCFADALATFPIIKSIALGGKVGIFQ